MRNSSIQELVKKLQGDKIDVFYGEDYVTVSLVGDLDTSLKKILKNYIKDLASVKQKLIAISCAYANPPQGTQVEEVVDALTVLESKLKIAGKQLSIIRPPGNLSQIIQDRMSKSIGLFRTLPEAIKSVSSEYDPSTEIAEFKKVAMEVFQVQFGLSLRPLPLRRIALLEEFDLDQVVGLIPLSTSALTGNLILRFSTKTLKKLSVLTFGEGVTVPLTETLQIAGELANMILGGAKEKLNMQGYAFNQTLPQMFYSTTLNPANIRATLPYWKADFESDIGNFSLEISLNRMGGRTTTSEPQSAN